MFEDRILIIKAKQGEWTAFEQIYEKYLDALLTIAFSLLSNHQEAEDVVHDVFAKFMESLATFQLRGSLKGFLATCVANRCRDHLRNRKRHARHHDRIQLDDHEGPICPSHAAVAQEQATQLQHALQAIPGEQREMIVLKIHSDLSFRALARQLALPLGTVQGRYRTGMQQLRSLLSGDGD